MDVGRRQDLRQPADGLHVYETHVRHPVSRTLELVSFGAGSVDDEHEMSFVRQGRGGFENELYRLRQAHVAGVHHDGLVLDSELAPVGVLSCTRCNPGRVDEVGDDSNLGGWEVLAPTLLASIVREDGDCVRSFVAESSRNVAAGLSPSVEFQYAELDRDVWVNVLDVEDEGRLAAS